MEGQARRTEYAVTDAACFRVRFTQRTPTVKALRTGRESRPHLPNSLFLRLRSGSLQPDRQLYFV